MWEVVIRVVLRRNVFLQERMDLDARLETTADSCWQGILRFAPSPKSPFGYFAKSHRSVTIGSRALEINVDQNAIHKIMDRFERRP